MNPFSPGATATLPASSSSPISDPSDVVPIITSVAQGDGVDPVLAVADAVHESGLNPGEVGDNGTSVGLYQLHWGGELNALGADFQTAAAAASNPQTNAGVALAQFAAVEQANPSITDPGQIAALAERPADPSSYAAAVDSLYSEIKTAGVNEPGSTTATTVGVTIPNPLLPGTTIPIPNPLSGAANSVANTVVHGMLYVVFLAGGVGLVVLAAARAAAPKAKQAAAEAAPIAAAAA